MPNANGKARKKDSARLLWDTKPRRAPNPKDIEFQTAEVVIPNPKTAGQLPFSFRNGILGETELDKQKMNRLIWGDNLLAMQALLNQGYEGKINLIYIDPPFDSKADYSHRMTIEGNEFTKEPSVIERLAYKDTWTGGTDSYLDMLYPRLQLMKRLLADDGSIWVHLDHNIGHYVKVIMDEIFGKENFLNEITWLRSSSGKTVSKNFPRDTDFILFYAKSNNHVFNPTYKPLADSTKAMYNKDDGDGKGKYRLFPLQKTGGPGPETTYDFIDNNGRVWKCPHKGWRMKYEKLKALETDGRLYIDGNTIAEKAYWDERENEGRISNNLWNDIANLQGANSEILGYDTQKPKKLLDRIVNTSCPQNGFVADFFAGSGTTGAVAETLGHRWIMCELGKVGIQVTRARLVEMAAKPFLIENIGNYQREMIYLTGGKIWEMQTLILKLYGATPRDKTSGLGIRKIDNVDELVYVGYPDRPVTAKKAEELALMAQNLDGVGYRRLVILGWDYEYNYSQALESRLAALKDKIKTKVESRDIPPDIYDYLKKAKSEEDIEPLIGKIVFYERPYLKLAPTQIKEKPDGKIEVIVSIDKYVLMDIPVSQDTEKGRGDHAALMKLIKDNFPALIDYWAIDWDYDACTFKSSWQAFRGNGRKAKTVPITATETLEKKDRTIGVRVVDIFGNDAAATVKL